MKTTRLLLVLPFAFGLAACANSPEQKLLDADNAYAVTQNRVLKYVTLPECPTDAPACFDAAVKTEFKATAETNKSAAGADQVLAANGRYLAILNANGINCGAAATDTCP